MVSTFSITLPDFCLSVWTMILGGVGFVVFLFLISLPTIINTLKNMGSCITTSPKGTGLFLSFQTLLFSCLVYAFDYIGGVVCWFLLAGVSTAMFVDLCGPKRRRYP